MSTVGKVFLVPTIMLALLTFSGCPSKKAESAQTLTVGEVGQEAILRLGETHWYKVTLERENEQNPNAYRFILDAPWSESSNNNNMALLYRVFSSPDQGKTLEQVLQGYAQPNLIVSAEGGEIDNFVPTKSGAYFINIEGYSPSGRRLLGAKMRYNMRVENTPSPQLREFEGAGLAPVVQGPAVAYVNGSIHGYETLFHPVTLSKKEVYQIQVWASKEVILYLVSNSGIALKPIYPVMSDYVMEVITVKGTARYNSTGIEVPEDGRYYLSIQGAQEDYDVITYGVRVQIQDYPSREMVRSIDGTYSVKDGVSVPVGKTEGYLGQGESDTCYFPGKTDNVQTYRLRLDNPEKFRIGGLARALDKDGKPIDGEYEFSLDKYNYDYFWINGKDEWDSLGYTDPEGLGKYSFTIRTYP